MHLVTPKVYLIGTSIAQVDGIREWLTDLGVSESRMNELDLECQKNRAESLIALAGRRCYNSFEPGLNPNVTKTRTDFAQYIDNILKSGHGNVCEHVTVSFAMEGVSRVFTAEMNRHRAGMAISEGSLRYIRFEDIGFWMPDSIQNSGPNDTPETEVKKAKTQKVFKEAFQQAEDAYKKLLAIWSDELDPASAFAQKKALTSMFRRIVPMGVSSGGVWTGNLRAWRHIIELRTSEHAEEEIRKVISLVYDQLSEWCSNVFQDAEKNERGEIIFRNSKV